MRPLPAAPPRRRTMGDGATIVLALTVVVAALLAVPAPRLLAAGVAVAGLVLRRPLVVGIGLVVLASGLSAAAHAGLGGVTPVVLTGDEAVLVTDPEPFGGAVRADVRLEGARYEAVARGGTGHRLRQLRAGDRVAVRGAVSPPRARDRPWFLPRHVAGRLRLDDVTLVGPAPPPLALANGIRAVLGQGAEVMADADRALFLGLTIGDDREQAAADRDAFLAAGLTHLLAVSGQNVAFLLALGGPVLRRLGLGPRLVAVGLLLGLFVMVTRWEPSVLRATVMAFLAVVSEVTGRPASRPRLLALAVTVMVLVDPLLVHSVGFRLSVAATVGIIALSGPLAARIRGPDGVRQALAVTAAAQVGVAPVLLATFDDGMPLAALPANLLAGPVAGPVMAWGMTAGLVAGAGGEPVAALVHLPTRVALWWLRLVASTCADLPLPVLGGG